MVGRILIIFLLLFSTKFLWQVIFTEGQELPDLAIIWLMLYVLIYFWVFTKKSFYKYIFNRDNILILLFAGLFIAISPLSELPALTFRRSIALLFTVLFGFYITYRYSEKSILRLLVKFYIIVIVSFLIFYFIDKDVLLSQRLEHLGSYRGVFAHKNVFGRISAFGVLLFVYLYFNSKKTLHLILAMVLIVFTILSNSAGGLLILLLGLCLLSINRVNNFYLRFLSLMIIFGVGGLLMYYSISSQQFFGESQSLAGRYILWQRAILYWLEKPLFGYGYSAFWQLYGFENAVAGDLLALNWDAPHSHNGFIEILLAGGITGLLLYLSVITRFYKKGNFDRDIFWYCCMLFVLVTGLFENVPLVQNDFHLILFVVAYGIVVNNNRRVTIV